MKKAELFLKSKGIRKPTYEGVRLANESMEDFTIINLLTEFAESQLLNKEIIRDHDIFLKSSENGIYVNDQQRIGFQKGAKWMLSLEEINS